MFISVVIPTYNRRKVLGRTLDAVFNQTAGNDTYEVIVVDDFSSDDTEPYMRGMVKVLPNLIYIRHKENQGRVVARNDGICASHGDIVIFLDDDNVPARDFIEAHRRYHKEAGEEHLAIMGNPQFAPEVVLGSNFAEFLQSRYLGCRSPHDRKGIDYSDLPARCLGTLNCSIRRSDLLALGLLDTDFRYYGGEDEYLGHCLSRLGIRIVFGEAARTLHYDDVSIARYKLKALEATRQGLRLIMIKSPEYIENTQVRFLMPIDWHKDPFKRIIIKLGMRALFNPMIVFILERWAIFTDRIDSLYFQPLYRLLSAAWIFQGYRSKSQATRFVTYGENRPAKKEAKC